MENTEQTPTTPVDSPRKERKEKKEKREKKEKTERKEKKSKRDSSSSGKEKKQKKDKKSKSTSENGTEESKPKTLEITEQKPQDDNETNKKSSESSPKEDKPSTSENTSQPTPITRSESQQTESKKDDNITITKTPSNDNSPSVPAIVVSNESTPSPSPTEETKNGNDLDNKLARSSSESKAISRSDSKSAEDDEEEEEEEEEPSKTAANAHGLVVFHTLRKPNTAIKQWESKRASLQPELLSRKTDSIQNLEKNANVSSTRKQWEGNMGQHREAIAPFAKLNDWQELEGAILSANLSSIRNKWKEIEKGKNDTIREPKPETPQPVGKLDVNQYLQAVNEKKEDSPTSPPPAQPRGNVMQFLREKRAEVHGEQPEKSKYDNLPPPPSAPISPLSGYSPTHASSAPSIAPSIAPTTKDKVALERHKSSADIKRDKEKSDKKAKADKKEKDKKEKNKSETMKVSGSAKRNTVDVVFAPPISKSKTLPTQPTTLYEYNATDNRMLSIHKDQVVKVLDKTISPHWILVEHDGKTGLFPATFLYIPDTNVTSTQTLGRSSTSKSSNPKGLFDVDEDEEAKARATDRLQGGEIKMKLLAAADEEDVLKNNDPLSLKMEEDDAEHNILYKEANNNSTKEIRGASLTKIIQKLTHERTSDSELLQCFLNTFTAFTTHAELLNLLVLRYRTPKPKALDMPTFQKTKLLPIRLRVINLLKLWIKKDYTEFKEGPLHDAARDFATRIVALSMPNPAKEILALLDEAKQGTLGQGRIVSGKPPTPHIPMNLKSDLTLMDIHPEEVARQLTLREHDLFKKIKSHECIKQKWAKEAQKENAQNIIRMIHRFNRISLWVATEIVSVEDLKLRAVLLNRFIFIAQKCLELNNFNAVMEILSALNNSAVHRLRRTWELLPPKSLEAMEDMTKLMDGEGNFAGYRETLRQAQPPILPYLGLVLTDLVFLDDGNPDIVPDTKLLNVAKWSLISGVVHREILTRGEITYTLEPLAFIQDFIEKRPVIENQHELYELSLKREARTKKTRKPVTTTKSTDK